MFQSQSGSNSQGHEGPRERAQSVIIKEYTSERTQDSVRSRGGRKVRCLLGTVPLECIESILLMLIKKKKSLKDQKKKKKEGMELQQQRHELAPI